MGYAEAKAEIDSMGTLTNIISGSASGSESKTVEVDSSIQTSTSGSSESKVIVSSIQTSSESIIAMNQESQRIQSIPPCVPTSTEERDRLPEEGQGARTDASLRPEDEVRQTKTMDDGDGGANGDCEQKHASCLMDEIVLD